MEVKVVSKRRNPFFQREEVAFMVLHQGEGTPSRMEVRRKIAALLSVPLENVYVRKIVTEYGLGRSKGTAMIYDSKEIAYQVEPEYIIKRNEVKEGEEAA
ncbi:MAG: 30S ribosomal protein S24e [Candidatus Freyarchaeota archaeon]